MVAGAQLPMPFVRILRLPEILSRGRRVCGQAIKETKIGYLFGSKMHLDGLPLHQDPEQDCDRSALGSIVDLEISGRFDSQSGFFSYLAF